MAILSQSLENINASKKSRFPHSIIDRPAHLKQSCVTLTAQKNFQV
jgi:hypothetical protein